ncbi:MAG: serine acetyltransferase [Bacteroidales bacterium]|jgi:serine O-acetyltransferase|nr:serine acetyltransferase [Bacteroidales bacterium]
MAEKLSRTDLPPKSGVADFTRGISDMLFPVIEGGGGRIMQRSKLRDQLVSLLKPLKERLLASPENTAEKFFSGLPGIKNKLGDDASFIASNDPAATDVDEVIMTYPGFYAILVYRIANSLAGEKVPLIPRIMTEYAHSLTGIDIHPKASIESPFFIDHGTGIVIGETSIIGKRVKLYQGVTIGALSVAKSMASTKRHPTIENDVIIYAGSTILGGETIIGHNSIIGGNVWLTESVSPFSLVYHENKVTVRQRTDDEADTKNRNDKI